MEEHVEPKLLSGFGQLARFDLSSLLDAFVGRDTVAAYELDGIPGLSSLALSTVADLGLGDLAYLDVAALQLGKYAKKQELDSELKAGLGEYVVGMRQTAGLVDSI